MKNLAHHTADISALQNYTLKATLPCTRKKIESGMHSITIDLIKTSMKK